ncbi:DUF2203 domain-containing protein [Acidobacteria bacterium AH-259-O06]|nr:DUF2203 domain-containing protein [Acidobacteria bacterium AH-259-O06]
MKKRFFTTEEARRLLPTLKKLIGRVVVIFIFLNACSGSEPVQTEPSSSPTTASKPAVSDSGLEFEAPSEWIGEPPSSSMRLAQYRLPRVEGDSEDAELVIYYFRGGGGSVQANVDRWIGQFSKADGSPAKDVARVSEKDSHGLHLSIVDVSGTYHQSRGPMMAQTQAKPNYRMLAAVAEATGGPWFFKLTGPQNTVDNWEDSFHSFLDTLRVRR